MIRPARLALPLIAALSLGACADMNPTTRNMLGGTAGGAALGGVVGSFSGNAGFGALLGDLIKSFVKRRLNKQPGERWFPWDQIDFLPTTLLLAALIVIPPLDMIICLIILSFALRVWIFPIIQKAIGVVR